MAEHPIQGLMDTAMSNIKAMVDVDTIVGNAVTAPDNTIIIPVSTVSFGFAAGGSDIAPKKAESEPIFGGGAGGGATVKPMAFLVVSNGNVRLLPVSNHTSPVDKIIDLVPELVDKVNSTISSVSEKRAEKKKEKEE